MSKWLKIEIQTASVTSAIIGFGAVPTPGFILKS